MERQHLVADAGNLLEQHASEDAFHRQTFTPSGLYSIRQQILLKQGQYLRVSVQQRR